MALLAKALAEARTCISTNCYLEPPVLLRAGPSDSSALRELRRITAIVSFVPLSFIEGLVKLMAQRVRLGVLLQSYLALSTATLSSRETDVRNLRSDSNMEGRQLICTGVRGILAGTLAEHKTRL